MLRIGQTGATPRRVRIAAKLSASLSHREAGHAQRVLGGVSTVSGTGGACKGGCLVTQQPLAP